MLNFKKFLLENDFNYIFLQTLLPNFPEEKALNMPLDSLDPEAVKRVLTSDFAGKWNSLEFDKQQEITNLIDSGRGNVKELLGKFNVSE